MAGRWAAAGRRRSPRAVMALASVGLGALAWPADPPRDPDDVFVSVQGLYHEHELDSSLREILRAMLQAGDAQTVPVALAQLDSARAQVQGEQFESAVMFLVDPGLPLVVPHAQRWPENARWHIGEHPVVLFLQLHQGRLDHVALMPDEGHYPHDVDPLEVRPVDDPDNAWPGPGDVTLTQETPGGVRPVQAGPVDQRPYGHHS